MSEEMEKEYRQELHNALEKFQFIEETLKMCIFSALQIARLELSSYFHIRYKERDINKLPLRPLTNIFSKINNDLDLHKDLKEIAESRNHVAHQSLLLTLGEWQDKEHMEKLIQEMKEVVADATDIHNRVLDVRYELIRSLHKVKASHENKTSSKNESNKAQQEGEPDC